MILAIKCYYHMHFEESISMNNHVCFHISKNINTAILQIYSNMIFINVILFTKIEHFPGFIAHMNCTVYIIDKV